MSYSLHGRNIGEDGENSQRDDSLADHETNSQDDDALRSGQQSYFTGNAQTLRPGSGIANHQRSYQRGSAKKASQLITLSGEVGQKTNEDDTLGIAVEGRIEESSKLGNLLSGPRQRTIEGIKRADHQNEYTTCIELSRKKDDGDGDIQYKANDRQYIRGKSDGTQAQSQRLSDPAHPSFKSRGKHLSTCGSTALE